MSRGAGNDAAERANERLVETDLNGDARALALVVEHEGMPIGDVLRPRPHPNAPRRNQRCAGSTVRSAARGGSCCGDDAAGEPRP